MVQATDAQHSSNPEGDFSAALDALTSALEDAAKAAQALQDLTPTIAGLSNVISELETRMDRARQVLNQQVLAAGPAPRPVALPTPVTQPEPPELPEAEAATDEPGATKQDANPCFILDVKSVSGPLDLKAVDSSVNGNPDVVDVALLDYDGRRATLKVWFDGTANLPGARAALRENLQRHLGGQPADISLERSEEPAA